jgi:hypothetical protein
VQVVLPEQQEQILQLQVQLDQLVLLVRLELLAQQVQLVQAD